MMHGSEQQTADQQLPELLTITTREEIAELFSIFYDHSMSRPFTTRSHIRCDLPHQNDSSLETRRRQGLFDDNQLYRVSTLT
jgi:hypothetical protein